MSNSNGKQGDIHPKLLELNRKNVIDSEDNSEAELFLQRYLPRKSINEIKQELEKKFPLARERQIYKKRIRKHGCPRKQQLSNTKKRSLGLYTINKNGLFFDDLLDLHHLWNEYIENYLDIRHLRLNINNKNFNYEEMAQQLFKADLHGAYMEVHKSLCPNLVGISGIVVFETRNTIKLLGKDNIVRSIPKTSCEFNMKISNFKVTFLGKNLQLRPVDRTIKKIRNINHVEL